MKTAAAFAIALGLLAASCSDGGTDEVASPNVTVAVESDAPADPFAAGRFFDTDLPTTSGPVAYYPPFYTARDLADAAGTAFVGRIVGTAEAVFELGATEEDVDGGIRYEFDGAIFEVLEVLHGDVEVGQTITIGIPIVAHRERGVTEKITSEFVEVTERGLRGEGPQYVVFAGKRPGTDVMFFYTDSGVAEVAESGRVVGLPGSYFANGDSNLGKPGGLTIADIRTSIATEPPTLDDKPETPSSDPPRLEESADEESTDG